MTVTAPDHDRPATEWPAPGERFVEEFRSSSARLLATTWWAISALAVIDVAIRGRDRVSLLIALGLLASDALLWLGAWRPAVRLYAEHVVLLGSLRDRSLSVASVTSAAAVGPLILQAGSRRFTSAAVGSTLRQRRRAGRETASVPPSFGLGLRRGNRSVPVGFDDSRMDAATRDALVGRTPGMWAAERITEQAGRARRAAGTTEAEAVARLRTGTRWVVAPAAVAAALILIFVVVAVS